MGSYDSRNTSSTNYSGTVTGSTSNPTTTFTAQYRRNGPNLEVSFFLSGSAEGSGYYMIPLPGNLSMDTSRVTLSTTIVDAQSGSNKFGTLLGHFAGNANGATVFLTHGVIFPSLTATSVVLVRLLQNVNTDLDFQRGNVLGSADGYLAAGLNIIGSFSVPINGWS